MASISFDGKSLLVDGRREWLVAATVHPARIVRDQWGERLRAAAQAGFNCVVVPVVWAHHEIKKGALDFTGERDIRAFVQMIGRLGMRAVLRPGPFLGGDCDLGGMPAYLAGAVERGADVLARADEEEEKPVRLRLGLRSGSAEFLQGASRWLNGLGEQVADLQVSATTARGGGGPIILVQVEHEWFCGHDRVGRSYLGELGRFLREGGINVPLINANNMYAAGEGEIEAWSGAEDMPGTMRQLRVVKPDQPPIALDVGEAPGPMWGVASREAGEEAARLLQRTLAAVTAGGGQFAVSCFHAGTRFGFLGGRSAVDRAGFAATAAAGRGATMLTEAGGRTPMYAVIKRLATFVSSFGRVFAHADADFRHAALADSEAGPAVIHLRGERGSAVFALLPRGETKRGVVDVLTPDGRRLALSAGGQACAWTLLDTHLTGRSTLDYTTFRPFAIVGRVLVLFGATRERGVVSINGGVLEAEAPTGKTPTIQEHEGVLVVVCDEALIDATIVAPNEGETGAVHIGVAALNLEGKPVSHPDFGARHRITGDGAIEKHKSTPPTIKRPRAPSLGEWRTADCAAMISGASPRYEVIPGPASLDALGAAYGYGWHRVRFQGNGSRSKVWLFETADRAHVYCDGEFLGVVGVGPGAETGPVALPSSKGEHTLAVLVDNLGRASAGSPMDHRKGLYGHLWQAAPIAAGRGMITMGAPISPLAWRAPLMGVREGDRTDARRLTWSFQHRRKTPIFLTLDAFVAPGVILLNDEPIWWLEASDWTRIRIEPEHLKTGKNVVQAALLAGRAPGEGADEKAMEHALHALGAAAEFHEGEECVTAKAEWAFAPWESPKRDAMQAQKPGVARPTGPAWWSTAFKPHESDAPLFLDCAGLTKGQIFLNGRNLCRYFMATPTGKVVPPQRRYLLPDGWLKFEQANEVVIFDEHGASPTKVRLEYGEA